jgi:hypothetical protein
MDTHTSHPREHLDAGHAALPAKTLAIVGNSKQQRRNWGTHYITTFSAENCHFYQFHTSSRSISITLASFCYG